MSEGVDAAIFYVSVAALVGGVMRTVRASVERNVGDRAGMLLAACGVAGLIGAIVLFMVDQRRYCRFRRSLH